LVLHVVVRTPRSAVTADELRAFCRTALAAFKVPQHFWFVTRDVFPLTVSGKVQQPRLRDTLMTALAQGQN
jgi:acyl-CoA synthetase (AMP-forming)/AMP-acid ligase II